MNHGIIFAGSDDWAFSVWPEVGNRVSIRRAAGAYKIASHLRDHGWDIEVIDFIPSWTEQELIQLLKQRVNKNTKFFGISQTFPQHVFLNKWLLLVHMLRRDNPHIPIIAGSKQLYSVFNLNADYYVLGYGEHGIIELLKKLNNEPSSVVITEIDGRKIVYCDIHHKAFPEKCLSVKYEDRDFILSTERLTLELARGCKFECKFCSYNAIGLRGNYFRDMDSLYDELMNNYNQFGITNYHVADETINDSTEKLKQVALQVSKLPFKLDLNGYVRADLIASRTQDWEYISQIGLLSHYYGIETFNHESGKSIGKGLHPDKLKQGLLDAKNFFMRHNKYYRSTVGVIIGLPYETPDTFIDGINWVDKEFAPNDVLGIPLLIRDPYAGSRGNHSEFDRTWREMEVYSETSLEELGGNINELPLHGREHMRQMCFTGADQLDSPILWKTKDMNIWEAMNLYCDYIREPEKVSNRGCMVWNSYNYTTTGRHSIADMLNPIKDLKFDYKDHIIFFNEYKLKKLSI